ncbi:MAG: hypothetical protein IMZ55_18040 [Acidobacteria bacterium]|nr:hypothetical protein [Acidobacteriota bacterium]
MFSDAALQSSQRRPAPAQLELERLEGLPCGCVVAVQRARPSQVRFVSVEARGPHCLFASHRTDQILRIGDPMEWPEAGDEPDAPDDGDEGGRAPAGE